LKRDKSIWTTGELKAEDGGPSHKTEWRFNGGLDTENYITIVTREDKALSLAPKLNSTRVNIGNSWNPAPSGSYDANSWAIMARNHEHTKKIKIIPILPGSEVKNERDKPLFKIVCSEPGTSMCWPFGAEWVLTDDGVGQWE
jgi:hypothetical protein